MRKSVFLLVLCFLTLKNYSQISTQFMHQWDTVFVNGFGQGYELDNMESHSGSLYASKSCGACLVDVFVSSDGTFFSPTGLSVVASPYDLNIVDLTSDDINNGNLYAATYNSEDGSSIYSFDGSAWTKITGTLPPWDSTACVTRLLVMSNAVSDSLYAVVAGNNGVEIWKTSKTNIAWSLKYTYPVVYKYCSDAVVYHDSIFATISDLSTDDVFKLSLNGAGSVINSIPGINDPSNGLQALAVFNDTLLIGIKNYSLGAQLLKYHSSFGFDTVAVNGLGYANSCLAVEKIVTFNNKIFVLCLVNYGQFATRQSSPSAGIGGGPITACILTSDDGSTFYQSSPSGFGTYDNWAGEWDLVKFGNKIFAGGLNFGTGNGELYKIIVPTSSFSYNLPCSGNSLNTTNSSIDNDVTQWYLNGVPYSTATDTSFFIPSPGTTYTLSVVSTSINLVKDSVSHVFTSLPSPIVSYTQGSTINECINTTHGLGSYFNVSYPNGYWAAFWNTSVGVLSGQNPDYTFTTPYTIGVTFSDVNTCATYANLFVDTTHSTNVYGTVSSITNGSITDGTVYLFNHQPGSAVGDTLNSFPLSVTGDYSFASLTAGEYLIKVVPNPTTYPNLLDTYFGSEYQWDSAMVLYHGCVQTDTADILVLEPIGGGGTGTISGQITQGPGFGNRMMVPGDPIPGVGVNLGRKPGGQSQMRTTTAANGSFTFTGVPIGDYWIFADIPNLPMDSTREVSITGPNQNSPNNNYKVDSTKIYVDNTTGILEMNQPKDNVVMVFPNPASSVVTIKFESKVNEAATVEIIDMLGNLVVNEVLYVNVGNNEYKLATNLNNLKKGSYLLKLKTISSVREQKILLTN